MFDHSCVCDKEREDRLNVENMNRDYSGAQHQCTKQESRQKMVTLDVSLGS